MTNAAVERQQDNTTTGPVCASLCKDEQKKGMMSFSRTCAHSPESCIVIGWNTRTGRSASGASVSEENRSTLSMCDSHERLYRCHSECYVISTSCMTSGSVIVWKGIFWGDSTGLHMLINSSLTVSYQNEMPWVPPGPTGSNWEPLWHHQCRRRPRRTVEWLL